VFPSYLKTVEQVDMFRAAEFRHLTLELKGSPMRSTADLCGTVC
jgi:hypothetical protein